MKTNKLILLYTAILMLLSQTMWAKAVIFLAIPLLIILILKHYKINSLVVKKLLFLYLIFFIGLISAIPHLTDYDTYFLMRDMMYFIQAPMFILIGIYLYKEINDLKIILKTIVLTSFLITVYDFYALILDPLLIFRLGLETRYEFDLSNATAVLAFVIIFYARKVNFKLFNNYFELLIMLFSLLSVAISFSRTTYVLLLFILFIPFIAKRGILFILYGASVLLVLFTIFGGLVIDIKAGGVQGSTFESKLTHSFDEMFVRDYDTSREVSHNWRGYEAFLGLSKYYEGNIFELLFGQGYGAIVITPFWVFHGELLNTLPIFHNGYITIILKTGIVGLLFFFLFLYLLLKMVTKSVQTSINTEQVLTGRLLQAIVFIIFFQTFVVHGLFFTTPPVLLLILTGVLIQFLAFERTIRMRV